MPFYEKLLLVQVLNCVKSIGVVVRKREGGREEDVGTFDLKQSEDVFHLFVC